MNCATNEMGLKFCSMASTDEERFTAAAQAADDEALARSDGAGRSPLPPHVEHCRDETLTSPHSR